MLTGDSDGACVHKSECQGENRHIVITLESTEPDGPDADNPADKHDQNTDAGQYLCTMGVSKGPQGLGRARRDAYPDFGQEMWPYQASSDTSIALGNHIGCLNKECGGGGFC